MASLLLVAAGLMSMSPARGEEPQAGRADYPVEALRKGEQGDVTLSMCVGVDGKARDVKVVKSSGSEALDKASVANMAHVKFTPARDPSGKVIEWCDPPYQLTIAWRLPR